jgi:hypothetical protein
MLSRNRRNLAHLLHFSAEFDMIIPLHSLQPVQEEE